MPDERKRPEPAVEAVLTLLCELFPKAFARYEARRRPLKIGIYDDLITALDGAVTVAELSAALRVYCTNRVYRNRLIAGAPRFDLAGNVCGEVSPEQARAVLPKPKPAQKVASSPPPKPKPRPPKPPPPPPPEPLPPAAAVKLPSSVAAVRRMSLADLRAAARRRKMLEVDK
jgi:sRNA-binding protein